MAKRAKNSEFAEQYATAEELSGLSPGLRVDFVDSDGPNLGHLYVGRLAVPIRLDDREEKSLRDQLASEVHRAWEELDIIMSDLRESAGERNGWAVIVRYPDARPDTIAHRTESYRTAVECADALTAELTTDIHVEVRMLDEPHATELSQEPDAFSTAAWAFRLERLEQDLHRLRCTIAKAFDTLRLEAATRHAKSGGCER